MNMFWFSFIQLSILGFLPVQHFVLTFAAFPGSHSGFVRTAFSKFINKWNNF